MTLQRSQHSCKKLKTERVLSKDSRRREWTDKCANATEVLMPELVKLFWNTKRPMYEHMSATLSRGLRNFNEQRKETLAYVCCLKLYRPDS